MAYIERSWSREVRNRKDLVNMDKIREMRRQGFNQRSLGTDDKVLSILQGLESLDEVRQDNYTRISEASFVNNYLDAFFGIGEDHGAIYAKMVEWILEIAGNFNLPVHVCDNHNRDKILFTVPPITNVNVIDPTKVNGRDINIVSKMAEDAGILYPGNVDMVLKNHLPTFFRKLYDKNMINNPDVQVWLDIQHRYKDHLSMKQPLNPEIVFGERNNDTNTQENTTKPPQDDHWGNEVDCGI
jgi:hypothetical protein